MKRLIAATTLTVLSTLTSLAEPGLNESSLLTGNGNWTATPDSASVQLTTRYANTTDASSWSNETTRVYWGRIYLDGSTYTFGKKFDDSALLAINGTVLINNTTWSDQKAATFQLPAGWYTFELRLGQSSGNVGPTSGGIDGSGFGIAYTNASHTSWTAITDPGDGSFLQTDPINVNGFYWNGAATDWADLAGWSGDYLGATAAAALPGAGDIARFSTYWTRTYQQLTLSQNLAVSGLVSQAWESLKVDADGTDRTLTLGSAGITVSNVLDYKNLQLGSDGEGKRVNLLLGSTQTWTAIGNSDIKCYGSVAPATALALTLAPTSYSVWFYGPVTDGTAGAALTLIANGTGHIRFATNNATYSGGTILSNGNTHVAVDNSLGTGPVTLAGGTLYADAPVTLTNDLIVPAGASVPSPKTGGWSTLTLSGRLSGSGTLTSDNYWWYNGLILAGDNSAFTGTYNLNGSGHCRSRFTNPAAGSAAAVWNFFNTGTDTDNNSGALRFSNGTIHFGALNGNTHLRSDGTNTVIIGERNENCLWGGTSDGDPVIFQKEGSATLTLTNASAHSGGTRINAGTVIAGHASALGTGPIAFGGGTLRYASGITTDWSASISNSTAAITLDDGGQSITYATALNASNVGGLVKKGAGILTLNAKPVYQGGTTVEAGTLIVKGGFDTGALTLAAGARLLISPDFTAWTNGATPTLLTYTSLSGTLDATTFGVTNVSRNQSVQLTFEDGKVTAAISAQPIIWQGADGAGWLDANAWIGSINREALSFSDWDQTIFDATAFGSATSGTNAITIASEVHPASLAFEVPAGFGYRLSGSAIIGDEGLDKSGAGSLILANTNAFTGDLTVTAGEVVLAGGNVASTNITLAAGTRLAIESAETLTIPGSLTGSGKLEIRSGASLALTNAFALPAIRNDGALELATAFASPALATRLYGIGLVTKTRDVQLIVTNLDLLNGLTGGLRVANGNLYITKPGTLTAPLILHSDEYRRYNAWCNLMIGAPGRVILNRVTIAGDITNTVSIGTDGSASGEFAGTLAGEGALELYCYWWHRPYYISADATAFTGSLTLGGRTDGNYTDDLYLRLANPIGIPNGVIRFRPTKDSSKAETCNLEWNPATSAGSVTIPIGEVQTVFDDGQNPRPDAAHVLLQNQSSGTVATFAIGGRDTDSRFEGTLKNGAGVTALAKVGDGTLTFPSAAILTYTGATTVKAGTLELDAALQKSSALTVESGAILTGIGIVSNAATFEAGSFLTPGTNGLGRLTFATTPSFAGTTLFLGTANGTFASGLNVNGTLNLANVKLSLLAGSQALAKTATHPFASCTGLMGKPTIDIPAPNGYAWVSDYANGVAFLRLTPDGSRVILR